MVLRQDYILRLIQQLSLAMARLIKKVDSDSEEIFLEALDGELDDLAGLPLSMLRSMPLEHILGSMKMGEESDAPRILAAAEILGLDARRKDLSGQEAAAAALRVKALGLYLPSMEVLGDLVPSEIQERVEQLLDDLREWDFPLELGLAALRWLEGRGRWAEAEDLLFSMAEGGCETRLYEAGRNFYLYLATLEDSRLEAGGLPADEVEEGLRSWMEFEADGA